MLMAMLVTVGAQAEDIVQVKPFSTTKGVTLDNEKSFFIEMTNESTDVWSVELCIKLPAGMEIAKYDNDYALLQVNERVPKGKFSDYYNCQGNLIDDGTYKILLYNTKNKETITGTSGAIIEVFYTTSATMADGIYPITIDRVIVGDTNSQPIAQTAEASSSYVTIGETSPITTDKDLDLSNVLTNYVPSFVVTQLNTDMAANENLRSVKLAETTFGEELTIPENVVYQVGTMGGLKRSFPGGQKSTVCLPFALSEEQVTAVKEKGCAIEVLSGYNADKSSVQFTDVTTMAAHTPYLVTVTGEMPVALFDGLTGIEADLTAMPTDVTTGAVSMKGAYEKSTISSETGLARYAYDAADGSFVRIGSNATLLPYRAYLELASSTAASRLVISDDETTGIGNVNGNGNVNRNGNGKAQFFDLQGRRVSEAVAKGVYIKNGRKFIKK